jgi:hypothetical protein
MTFSEYVKVKTPYKLRVLWGVVATLALVLWPVSPVLAVIAYLVIFQVCRYIHIGGTTS